MADQLTQSEEEQVLERIVRNQIQIKELEAENATLKGFFKQSPEGYPAGSRKTVGKFYIQVSENKRIDDALAQKVLTPVQYRGVSKTVINVTLAKAILAPPMLEKITKKFENKIEIGLNS